MADVAPPRPDPQPLPAPPSPPAGWQRPEPVRRRAGWIQVTAVIALVALGIVALAQAVTTIDPSAHKDEYRFLLTDASGDPVRWNPCDPIHYVVNVGVAPPGSLNDVQESVLRISRATGITFVYDGLTDEVPSLGREPYQPGEYGERWAPVLIAWVSPQTSQIAFERDGHTAAGVATPMFPDGRREDVYVSGWIAINAADPNPPGFDSSFTQGPTVLHELGHVMGLAHVRDQGELMERAGGGVTDLGPGDLEGLRRLGRAAGCLTVPALPA